MTACPCCSSLFQDVCDRCGYCAHTLEDDRGYCAICGTREIEFFDEAFPLPSPEHLQ